MKHRKHKKIQLGEESIHYDSILKCWVLECPLCGIIHASVSGRDKDLMPVFAICEGEEIKTRLPSQVDG